MKTLLTTLLLSMILGNAHAYEATKRAVIRDEDFKAIIDEVKLTDLTRDDAYEGTFFKIVKGKDNEPVRFDDTEDMQLRAATTYYH